MAGYDVEWMHAHAEPRCPDCHGQLRYERYDSGTVVAQCVAGCDAKTDRLPEIRETIADLYSHAFDEAADSSDFLRF